MYLYGEKNMKTKFALPVLFIALIFLFVGCQPVSDYATSERLNTLSEKYDELKDVSNRVSEKLTASSDSTPELYDAFNELAVSANALATEVNSYIDKQIEKNACESLISRCEELLSEYKKLEDRIPSVAEKTEVPSESTSN